MADVKNSFQAARTNALGQLESYGIDPSQTRFGALDLSTRIAEAAATAAAGTQSRLNTEATGLALQGEAIKTGRGYAPDIAQAYASSTNAGGSGLNYANQTFGTGAKAMQAPIDSYGNILNTGYQNQMQAATMKNQQSTQFSQGLGQLIGGGIGMAAGLGYIPTGSYY
jgi:hypothetical protein